MGWVHFTIVRLNIVAVAVVCYFATVPIHISIPKTVSIFHVFGEPVHREIFDFHTVDFFPAHLFLFFANGAVVILKNLFDLS